MSTVETSSGQNTPRADLGTKDNKRASSDPTMPEITAKTGNMSPTHMSEGETTSKSEASEPMAESEQPTISASDSHENNNNPKEKLTIREQVLQELYTTEEQYLHNLEVLISHYILPLRHSSEKSFFDQVHSDPNVTLCFQTVELILKANRIFYQQLKAHPGEVGKTFCNNVESTLSYYGLYCNYQDVASVALVRAMQKMPEFATFIEEIKKKETVKQQGIDSYLAKPFQRLTKYPLLLKELLKNTDPSDEDRPHIEKALNQLNQQVEKINQDKRQVEEQKKQVALSKSVTNVPNHFNILAPSRKVVYDGLLQKISGNHDQERYFVLFTDTLMYCAKKGTTYECKDLIPLKDVEIVDLPEDNAWKIKRNDKNRIYKLYGKGPSEKINWLNQINNQKQRSENVFSKGNNANAKSDPMSKSVIRVYFSHRDNPEAFKAFAVEKKLNGEQFMDDIRKKLVVDNIENLDSLSLFIQNHNKLRQVELNEDIFSLIRKEGPKFGTSAQHTFRLLSPNSCTMISVQQGSQVSKSLEIPILRFYQIADELEDHVSLQDRKSSFSLRKKVTNCFLGRECVDWLLRSKVASEYILTRQDAIAFGQKLIDLNLIAHADRKPRFEDSGAFYQFKRHRNSELPPNFEFNKPLLKPAMSKSFDSVVLSPPPPNHENRNKLVQSDLGNEEMHSPVSPMLKHETSQKQDKPVANFPTLLNDSNRNSIASEQEGVKDIQSSLTEVVFQLEKGVSIKDRYYHLKKFRNCFVSQEAVDWMISYPNLPQIQTRKQAISLGQQLVKNGLISHLPQPLEFQDGYFFYTVTWKQK